MPELRRQHRIAYKTNVRLRASGRDQSVVARVQNLSARGMFVTAADMPEAGCEVQCRIEIAGERRSLRGRVAWVRQASSSETDVEESPSGAGIEFIELGAVDADLLRGLIDPVDEERHPVDVSFEGMKAPIRCHAIIRPESLQITTKLPFLRLLSQVKVSFSLLGLDEVRAGTLGSITLDPTGDDGIPQLCLNVATPVGPAVQGTIDVAPAPRVSTPAEGVLLSEPSTVVDPDVAVGSPSDPGAQGMTLRRVPVADRDRTMRIERDAKNDLTRRVARASSAQGAVVRGASPKGQAGWHASVTGFVVGAVLVLGAGLLLRRRPVDLVPTPPARSVVVVAPVAPAPVPVEVKPDPPSVVPPPAEVVAQEAAPVNLPPGLHLDDKGDRPVLSVSFSGSTRGARRYVLANPPGLAIHLPRARARTATGVYKVNDRFSQVWIRSRGAGSNLRFFFDTKAYAGEITIDRDKATLTLRPR